MKRSFLRSFSLFTATIIFAESVAPFVACALTSGPSQPEMQTFQPAGTSEMVDLFTGDFSYNIPLLDVGGYPINLSYRSGITMDQEASWVGLGWNINPGVINRSMRGLPDDFNGDPINKSFNIKNNVTAGLSGGAVLEAVGFNSLFSGGLSVGAGFYHNTYKGLGLTAGATPSISIGKSEGGQLTGRLGIQFDSQNGLDVTPSFGYSKQVKDSERPISRGLNAQLSINSRAGLRDASWGFSQSYTDNYSHNGNDANYSTQEGVSTGSSISFASSTYLPSLDLPYHSNAFSLRVTAGGEATVFHPGAYLSGFFNEQHLSTKSQQVKGYGYLFSKSADKDPTGLMDFNREKDGPFRETAKTLPVSNFTYDLYSVSGEGVGGQFRPFRGDVGILRDPYVKNTSDGGSLGAELGVGFIAHGGVDISFNYTKSTSGMWSDENILPQVIPFRSNDGETLYESFYFKNVGDNGSANSNFYDDFGATHPLHSKLLSVGPTTLADQKFMEKTAVQNYSERTLTSSQSFKKKREKRNQVMSFLNNIEAHKLALEDTIWSYPLNTLSYDGCGSTAEKTPLLRISRPLHHMSEITVLNGDGKRFIYGIAAYNNTQKEVTFSVDKNEGNSTTGYTDYDTSGLNPDNSINNIHGRDNYFSSTELPSYAHSFLLTGVLSQDYIDITGDGITDDDLGDAVKFNYTRTLNNYGWRLPYQEGKATYVEGYLSDQTDDKGNYVYGAKEIWYGHSIETRNFVAQFILSDRNDGLGVVDENGGQETSAKLKRLQEIRLYSKEELIKNGADAVPIKTVHFRYTYSLCKKAENNINYPATSPSDSIGKLTLNEIWFTYGDNTKGRLNGYQFVYGGSNPNYSTWKNDRWGNYQNNNSLGLPPNKDYPYSYQDSVEAASNASAWSLTQITLPSGGKINVTYESDDYGFVQDKRAMQMYRVLGFDDNSQDNPIEDLYNGASNNLHIKLDAGKPIDDVNDLISGLSNVYFKFKVGLTDATDYEYVSGYAKIVGVHLDGYNHHFWVELKSENADQVNHTVHPVSKAAWQFLRVNLPDKTHTGSASSTADPEQKILSLMGLIPEIKILFTGFNSHAIEKEWGQHVDVSNSWMRLNNLGYKKYGGGSRVKKIALNDNWYAMTDNLVAAADYGQSYEYLMKDPVTGTQISSGVAAYEPLHGGDEIPQRNIIATYEEETRLAPDNEFYVEAPLGESLYPAPTVGYREVTVANLKRTGIARTATGKSVHKFYTAYDFPTITDHTDLNPKHYKPTPLIQIFKTTSTDYMTASQGYTVICNDMHGKQKGDFTYDETGALIASTEFKYKVEDEATLHQRLANDNIDAIDSTGLVTQKTIGRDIDIWQDMREQYSSTEGFTTQGNLETFSLVIVPIVAIPSVYMAYSSEKVRFRSAVTTKYIFEKGILDHVTKMENGSSVTTYNEVFDEHTGEVVVSRVVNEYGDDLYTFNYPAHWMYSGMAGAYKNIGAEVKNVHVSGGVISPLPSNIFEPGDEVAMYTSTGGLIGLCTIIKPQSDLILIDQTGKPISLFPEVNLKVIRSGHRNLQTVTVGSVTSTVDPILSGGYLGYSDNNIIVNASALQFKDEWQTNCKKLTLVDCVDMDIKIGGCFRSFYNAFFMVQNFWVLESDNYTVQDLYDDWTIATDLLPCPPGETSFLNYQPSENYQFYYTYPPSPTEFITYYEAQLGDSCKLSIQSLSGNPIPIDSLYFSPNNTDSTIELNDNAYLDCIDLYFGNSSEPVATACIECKSCATICTDLVINDTINPYRFGLRGNWRPWKDHVYYAARGPELGASMTNITKQGVFSFNTFWEHLTSPSRWYPNTDSPDANWVRKNEITTYNSKGIETENKDALDRYSAALYGYIESLPTAVASNSQPRQIAFDGFEDYTFANSCSGPCYEGHWSFLSAINSPDVSITSDKSHSGRRSIVLAAGETAQVYRDLGNTSSDMLEYQEDHISLKDGGCLYRFSPPANDSSYIISAWVHEDGDCDGVNFTHDTLKVITDGSSLNATAFLPKGPIIDGWQRIEGTFTVPAGSTSLTVKLISSHSDKVYFDDVRIFPFFANMKTYVYDPFTLRLMATLDENNYATFYEYDDEGSLIRLKRETERGVVTVQENASELKKQ